MIYHRQPKLPFASSLIAAGSVAIWLGGASACNLAALFCCDSHGSETVAHVELKHSQDTRDTAAGTNHADNVDAHRLPEGDGHTQDSPRHNSKDGLCCSTLKAVVQSAKPLVVSMPTFQPIPFLCERLETHVASLVLSTNPPDLHDKSCDRIFTPEVCLGPAFRINAPPAVV